MGRPQMTQGIERDLADRGIGPDGRWAGLAEAYKAIGVDAAEG